MKKGKFSSKKWKAESIVEIVHKFDTKANKIKENNSRVKSEMIRVSKEVKSKSNL